MKPLFLAFLLIATFAYSNPKLLVPADQKPPEKKEGLKSYSDVITKEAKTDSGLFIVHRIKQKFYFEIPNKELGKDFLLVTTQSKVQSGLGYGGDAINQQVVRWERDGDRILLKSILYAAVAPDSLPIHYAVQKATLPPIIMVFDIQTINKDSSTIVIDATDLFTADNTE